MATFYNRVWVGVASAPGTGTITLGSAISNAYCTAAEAGAQNNDVLSYVLEDGNNFEIGIGTYSAGTLTRTTVRLSKIAGVAGTSKVDAGANATVFLLPAREDIALLTQDNVMTGPGAAVVDNAAARFNGTGGASVQSSPLIIADTTGALSRSGGGGIPLQGTNTNDSAAAGDVGEYASVTVTSGSAVALTTNVAANIGSFPLAAGEWDVSAVFFYTGNAATTVQVLQHSISLVSATLDLTDTRGGNHPLFSATLFATANPFVTRVGPARMQFAVQTTVYFISHSFFTTNTCSAYLSGRARRVR